MMDIPEPLPAAGLARPAASDPLTGAGAAAPEACPAMLDVLILGAGPVGLTLYRALARGGLRVRLVDRKPLAAQASDPRALALSQGARELLETLAAWPARQATPIETIHVSQRGGFGRSLIDRADYDLPALGYVVRYRDLAAALAADLPAGTVIESAEIMDLADSGQGRLLTLRAGGQVQRLAARLIVHAEGSPGPDQGGQDAAWRVRDYGQHAVICEATPVFPQGGGHGRRAWERFTPQGPLALLPLGEQYSIVFTLPPAAADAVMAMDDAAFCQALAERLGGRLQFTQPGPRSRFPLALRWREQLVEGDEVWIGNSAQTLHPVSGQGFNLGLRDAWALAECLLEKGVDREALARYARRRRLDRGGGALFTDGIVRVFSNDLAPLRLARGLGLLALDLFPPARHFVAKRMIWGARAWP